MTGTEDYRGLLNAYLMDNQDPLPCPECGAPDCMIRHEKESE